SSSSSGGKIFAIVASGSSRNSYSSALGRSSTLILSPISKCSTFTVIPQEYHEALHALVVRTLVVVRFHLLLFLQLLLLSLTVLLRPFLTSYLQCKSLRESHRLLLGEF